tara:strand:+ start:446 stop:883 length:438 start_codon:yes stop_codon:yes gene_type:complete
MYNFYVILVLLSILSPIIAYNKVDILKNMSITNDIFYTSLALLIITFLIKLYKKDVKFKINKLTKKKLLYQILLIIPILYLGGLVLKNENVIVYKSYQKSFSIFFLLLYSVFFMKMEINISTIIGCVLIILGLYLVDKSINNIVV